MQGPRNNWSYNTSSFFEAWPPFEYPFQNNCSFMGALRSFFDKSWVVIGTSKMSFYDCCGLDLSELAISAFTDSWQYQYSCLIITFKLVHNFELSCIFDVIRNLFILVYGECKHTLHFTENWCIPVFSFLVALLMGPLNALKTLE